MFGMWAPSTAEQMRRQNYPNVSSNWSDLKIPQMAEVLEPAEGKYQSSRRHMHVTGSIDSKVRHSKL